MSARVETSGRELTIGEPVEVAPGVLCLRLPLPIELDHVNVYLLEDHGGWTLFDTGLGDDASWSIWQTVIESKLGGLPIVKVLASHFHVDHVGLAGRLTELFRCPLYMTQTEYLMARLASRSEPMTSSHMRTDFFLHSGASADAAQQMSLSAFRLEEFQDPLPRSFQRLSDGDSIEIGGRSWSVRTGSGHSPEQLMLFDHASGVFISADQVLPGITPNVSVWPMQPDADPLGDFLESLERIWEEVDDPLVLPCHRRPFRGLQARTRSIVDHHLRRCDALVEACGRDWQTAVELVPAVFGRRLEDGVMDLAVGETLAHVNYLCARGRLKREIRGSVWAYRKC